MMNPRNLFVLAVMVIAALLRIFNVLPYNFSPIAAIALFGGAMFTHRPLAFLAPLAIMFVSDVFVGFHNTMWAVYLSFMLVVLIGHAVRRNPTMVKGLIGALAGSVVFFLITNAAAWYTMPEYTKDLAGLMNSYTLGLPFYRGTLAGDLIFTAGFFGLYELAKLRFPILAKA